MPDLKVSAFPTAVTPLSTDVIPIVSGGIASKVTLAAAVAAAGATFTPVLSAFTQSALPGTLNITTDGAIDWFLLNTTSLPRLLAPGNQHAKAAGGGLMNGFDWALNGAATPFTNTTAMAITSSAGDDLASAVLAASVAGAGILNASGINWGYRLRIPATQTTRILRLYGGVFSGTVTFTATLTSGNHAPVTFNIVTTAGVARSEEHTSELQS